MTDRKPSFTPGPWESEPALWSGEVWYSEVYADAGPEGDKLPAQVMGYDRDTVDANACLIAAAPDLLWALSELVAEFDADSEGASEEQGCYGLNETNGIEAARAAIAKALGLSDD